MAQVIPFKRQPTTSTVEARGTGLTDILNAINGIAPLIRKDVEVIEAVALNAKSPEPRVRLLRELQSLERQLRLVEPLLTEGLEQLNAAARR